MILKIRSAGEPVLREQARPLRPEEIRQPSTQALIDAMRETMHDAPGVGLAAPQVGVSLQLAVIEDREEFLKDLSSEFLAERERKPVAFEVIINPVLTVESEPEVEFFEGCLSLPGLVALVPRARKVKVECLDAQGKPRVIRASGWHARILQHEIDHLRGTLYVDRMRSASLSSVDNFNRHWKGKTISEIRRVLH
ncbi:MAG TPA: peptide deformylase [Acidobacteriaceae bacterium]|nr:peptide deformylase [Acidobacteriaceae bacterium]